MSTTGIVLVVIGVIVALIGVLRHFASLAILGGLAHASIILFVIGVIVAIVGVVVGQSSRRSAV
ncbi:MAG TPA: hypothetical protein VIU62_09750 [Chloroflexota bacterium]